MSLLRHPLSLVRRCSALLSRAGFTAVRQSSTESSESRVDIASEGLAGVVSESLIREAVAAVKESHAVEAQVVEDELPPMHSYPEKYGLEGFEYTGRANIDYTDPYIHYKLEVDMETLRLDQPTPR